MVHFASHTGCDVQNLSKQYVFLIGHEISLQSVRELTKRMTARDMVVWMSHHKFRSISMNFKGHFPSPRAIDLVSMLKLVKLRKLLGQLLVWTNNGIPCFIACCKKRLSWSAVTPFCGYSASSETQIIGTKF